MKWFNRHPMKETNFHIVNENPDIERWYAVTSNCDAQAGAELLDRFKLRYNAAEAYLCCTDRDWHHWR